MFYSLRSRLIAFFVLLFVLSFGALSVLIFNESRSIIRSYIESSALEKMDEYGSYIDMVQKQIYDLASLAFNSDETDEWNTAVSDPSLTEGEKMLAHIKLSNFLTQATNSYSSISSVAAYRGDTWISLYSQVVLDDSIPSQLWYKRFRDENNRWVPAHVDEVEQRVRNSDHPVVSMLMPIRQLRGVDGAAIAASVRARPPAPGSGEPGRPDRPRQRARPLPAVLRPPVRAAARFQTGGRNAYRIDSARPGGAASCTEC